MALDILNPVLLKKIDTIGGFCLVESSKIDYIKYFPVDAAKIGVTNLPVGYAAAVKSVGLED